MTSKPTWKRKTAGRRPAQVLNFSLEADAPNINEII
jgi:hypothetical protein